MAEQDKSVSEWWDQFKSTGEQEFRDRLILNYAPLVKYVAGRVAVGLPRNIEESDLVSYGIFGLIDAINKFDPERNIKFETYAIARIKGAIIDELRTIDWVPRSVRTKARKIERAYATLEAKLSRTATDQELAKELGVSSEDLSRMFYQISFVGVAALDEVLSLGADRSDVGTLGDTLADKGEGPAGEYEFEEMKQVLAQAISKLGEREKTVLTLYYYERLTLAEIGKVLEVTESRVCQIHTKAVLILRSRMEQAHRPAAN